MPHASDDVVRVAEVFATVARSLADLDDLSEALEKIVHLAVDHLEACEFAGISLVEKRTITSPASSNDLPKKLDEIQSEAGEGPCIDAIKSMRSSRRATCATSTAGHSSPPRPTTRPGSPASCRSGCSLKRTPWAP